MQRIGYLFHGWTLQSTFHWNNCQHKSRRELCQQQLSHVLYMLLTHHVYNDAEYLNIPGLEVPVNVNGRIDHLCRRFMFTSNYDEYRCGQILSNEYIRLKFESGTFSKEITTLYNCELIVLFRFLVLADDRVNDFTAIFRLRLVQNLLPCERESIIILDW